VLFPGSSNPNQSQAVNDSRRTNRDEGFSQKKPDRGMVKNGFQQIFLVNGVVDKFCLRRKPVAARSLCAPFAAWLLCLMIDTDCPYHALAGIATA
jgi:hypothetical protein